jgi:acetylornithine deacetylase
LEDILAIIKQNVQCEAVPRSLRLRPSGISKDHPLFKAGEKLGVTFYGSPTTSDKALIPVPSIKLGPGDSARSHSADEFIYLQEIEDGINGYIRLIENL